MIERFATALADLRWETATDADVAQAVAEAVRAVVRVKAVELRSRDAGRIVVGFADGGSAVVERGPYAPADAGTVRRPRGGWTPEDRMGAEVNATQRTSIALRCRHTRAHLVLWTSRVSWPEGLHEGIAATLGVVVDARALVRRVATLSRSAHSDNRRLRRALLSPERDATAQSIVMRRCHERAHAVAPYDTPVLVTGPSGAGKELIARRIHAWSAQSAGPFIALNCGALPDTLAESELFGHRRGAFTGASRDHRGVFERAQGGTLLLDEVGELSPSAQVKLLRVLQEGSFTPLGSEAAVTSRARVITATHRDLSKCVADGSFREDLYYRIAVFEVSVPGLRERPEDLPALVHELLESIANRMGRPVPTVPRAVMERLSAYAWPGNVRELRNTLEGALVMTREQHLAMPLRLASGRGASSSMPATQGVPTFEQATRRAIEDALERCAGKIYGPEGAAALLALKPGTLQSKMRKLGVSRVAFVGSR